MPVLRRCVALLVLGGILALPAGADAQACDPSLGDPVSVQTGANPLHTVVADFNEDGLPDLAVSNSSFATSGSGSVAVLLGNGSSVPGPVSSILPGGNPYFLAAGDFNGDSILDLAATYWSTSAIGIYLGQGTAGVGNGTFASQVTYSAGGQPFQIVAGDYDEDGILDLAVAINNLPRVSVLRGRGAGGVGNGTFALPVSYPLVNLGRGIAQGDFNSDGILDLVATEYTAGKVGVLLGNGAGGVGNGTFAPAAQYAAGPEPVDLEVFDFNKDGILDLAVANGNSGGTVVLRGLGAGGIGSGAFAIQATLATGNTGAIVAGDVNEDGLYDLLAGEVALPLGRRLHLYLGNGTNQVGNGSWSFGTTIATSDEPYQIALADLDGDTHGDAIVTHYLSNQVTILTWDCRVAAPPPPDPRNPVLTRVRDVPADEGGRVYLTWLPSSLDVNGGAVTSYRVWREIPQEAAQSAAPGVRTTTRRESTPAGELAVTFWEEIATLAAQRLEGYGYTAPTTEDSTAANPVSTAFFVSALTTNINVSYSSNIARGASIDNLAPQAPANFRNAPGPAGVVVLAWSRNTEPDLGSYRLERSPSAAFLEGETTHFDVASSDTSYSDAAAGGAAYYRVAAIDQHDNASAYSPTVTSGGAVGAGGAVPVLALAGSRPNPATAHAATLLFSLASDAPATLEVFDVRGRRVAAPSLDGRKAGDHAVRLDTRTALAPGVYVVRLTQGGRALERKIAITP